MRANASDIVTRALRLLGVLGEGETASGPQGADGLRLLNELVDHLAIDGHIAILAFGRTQVTLTSGSGTYTIGTGGNINVTRPAWIEDALIIPDVSLAVAQRSEWPLDRYDVQQWARITSKDIAGTPTALYYDRAFSNTTERGTIQLWPVPNTANMALVLFLPSPLAQFADLDTNYEFAPGYPRMLRYQLALDLAPEYDATPSEVLVKAAALAKATIESRNTRVPELRLDQALLGRASFDMRAGRWR